MRSQDAVGGAMQVGDGAGGEGDECTVVQTEAALREAQKRQLQARSIHERGSSNSPVVARGHTITPQFQVMVARNKGPRGDAQAAWTIPHPAKLGAWMAGSGSEALKVIGHSDSRPKDAFTKSFLGTSISLTRSIWGWFPNAKERFMKYLLAVVAAASICAGMPANAEEVGVGVGVAPGVGAGVTVGSDHRDRDRDRTTVIKEREPRDTTVIREREREPDSSVTIQRERTIERERN